MLYNLSKPIVSSIYCLVALIFISTHPLAQGVDVKISAIDERGTPLAAVKIELKINSSTNVSAVTDEKGLASFSGIRAGNYELVATKEGFESRIKPDFIVGLAPINLELLMVPKVEITDTINVTATNAASNPIEQGASSSTEIQRIQAKDNALKPPTVADVLPLLPGIARTDQGELHIFGSGENRSALLVNSTDVTDPATGQFGLTVPVDSVQTINVFRTPYLAQYGRFTAGVVSVETRRGGDKWNFEINDPFPEFRYLRSKLRGLREATPRLIFNGPLIKNKLYFSQGLEYDIAKRRVLALPFPNNETINESINSFSQFDYLPNATHSVTGTFHVTPRQARYFNLGFFNERPVTPNFRARDYTGTLVDRWTMGTNLLESIVAIKKARIGVWGQGVKEMDLTPVGNTGNYFSEQERKSSRYEWQEIFSVHPIKKTGTHNFKFGTDITFTNNQGEFEARPVNIRNLQGQLLKRIEFVNGSTYNRDDLEIAGFAQDHWVLTPKLAVDLGLRFERQRITDTLRIAPRAGVAWTPLGNTSTVIRGGFGLFYDRVPLNVYSFSNYPEQQVTTFGPNGQIIDGPRRFINLIDQDETTRSLFILGNKNAIGNFAPRSDTWTIEAEHPINKILRIRANYQKSISSGLIIVKPKVVDGKDALSISGSGRSNYHQLELTTKFSWKDNQQLFFSYVRSRSRGELNEFNNYLGSFPYPIVRPNFYSNLPGDLPNRFLAWGTVKLPWQVTWFPLVELRNGFPYQVVDSKQDYVGIPNNDQLRYPKFFSFDSRARRDFKLNQKYTLRVSVSIYNATNHFNPPSVHNNIADPQFGLFFGQNKRRFRVDFDVLF